MTTWILKATSVAALLLAIVVPGAAESGNASQNNEQQTVSSQARVVESYGKLPLSFEANQGQAGRDVKFIAHGTAQTLSLGSQGAVLGLRKRGATSGGIDGKPSWNTAVESANIRMTFGGSNAAPQVAGLEKLPGVVNYYIGDKSQWRTGIPTFARVRFAEVYPGIDLDYHGNNRQLEYDFVVRSGANPQNIRLAFDGVQGLELDREGNLILHAPGGDLLQHKPVAYQEIGGLRQEVPTEFVVAGKTDVAFKIGAYDRSQTLVVDPVLAYSTYFGSANDDVINGIAVDPQGNAYIVGTSNSGGGSNFIFVNKINASGTASLYATGVGDLNCNSYGNGIAVDANGLAYVAGEYGTWDQWQLCNPKYALTAKFKADGTTAYSFIWGGGDDHANAVAVDAQGNAYFTGQTQGNWPVTANAFQPEGGFPGDPFILKLDPNGNNLYSTYIGGSGFEEGWGIAVDAQKNIVIVGGTGIGSSDFPITANAFQATNPNSSTTCFVTELNAAGSALIYSTFLGGEVAEGCSAVTVDATGKIYVTGTTESSEFPTTANAYDRTCGTDGACNVIFSCNVTCRTTYFEDAFVTKFDPTKTGAASLLYSTFIGGENRELGQGIGVDAAGNAWVTGRTASLFYPTVNPLQASSGGDYDVFVAEVNPAGSSLLFSSYLGGNGYDEARGLAVDAAANVYIAGQANSTAGFPLQNPMQNSNAGGADGFLLKLGTATVVNLNSLSLNPTVLNGPGTSTGTVTLTAPAAANITVNLSSNNTNAATVPATVVISAGNSSATFTVTGKTVAATATVTISGTYNGVTKTATLTVNPPAVSLVGVTLNPTTVTGGTASTGTVTLSGPATGNGITVNLSSSNSAAVVPASVVVGGGNTTANFTVTTSAVTADTTVTITASYNGVNKTATLTVKASSSVAVASLTILPKAVVGGKKSVGTVTLVAPATGNGVTVTLASNNPAIASVPASVLVSAGATTAQFNVTTFGAAANTVVTISATAGGVTKSATLTVKPAALTTLTFSPKSVKGGNNSTGTVKLNGPAPANGATITLSSSNTAIATVPATVKVNAGATSATFTIGTKAVAAQSTVTITVAYNGKSKSAVLTVTP